jgi:opacity protein-like surface antigen
MRAIAACGLAIVTVGALWAAQQVRAADLSPTYPAPPVYNEPDAQFEFGSGWYLRGDASFEPADHPVLSGADFNFNKRGWDYALGGGIGYKFNSFLRADITGDYFDPIKAQATVSGGGLTVTGRATLQRYDGLANLYVDLGDWYGITPYIGAGVGFRVFDPSAKIITTNAAGGVTVARFSSGSEAKFAWAAMAGVTYQVDPNIAIDLGYRHLDLGRFAATTAGYTIDHHFTEDQVRVGLRYMIY